MALRRPSEPTRRADAHRHAVRFALGLLCVAAPACDALLVDPAPAPGTTVDVVFDSSSVAGFGAREVWFRFMRGSEWRDTVVTGTFVDGHRRATVSLHGIEFAEGVDIEAEVRLHSGLVLFAGTGTLTDGVIELSLAPQPTVAAMVWGRIAIALSSPDGQRRSEMEIAPAPSVFDVSPLDATIVFQGRAGGGQPHRLYLLDPYTGAYRTVLEQTPPFLNQFSPVFSEDGRWIYFVGDLANLWRVRPDGSDLETVLPLSLTSAAFAPAQSHDGSRLVYRHDTPSIGELRILTLEGGATTSVGVVNATYAKWSPDDQWIAYRQHGPNGWNIPHLRVVRPNGTGDRAVAATLPIEAMFDWASDGMSILAVSDHQAVSIEVATGDVEPIPGLGPMHGVARAP